MEKVRALDELGTEGVALLPGVHLKEMRGGVVRNICPHRAVPGHSQDPSDSKQGGLGGGLGPLEDRRPRAAFAGGRFHQNRLGLGVYSVEPGLERGFFRIGFHAAFELS